MAERTRDKTHQIPFFVFAFAAGPFAHAEARARGFGTIASALIGSLIVLGLVGLLSLIPAVRTTTKRLWFVVALMPALVIVASLVSDVVISR